MCIWFKTKHKDAHNKVTLVCIVGTGRVFAASSAAHIAPMESTVRLCKPFTCGARPLNRQDRLMRRRASRQAGERSSVTQAAVQASDKSLIAKWAEDAGLRTNVSLEDFLGDRCCYVPVFTI